MSKPDDAVDLLPGSQGDCEMTLGHLDGKVMIRIAADPVHGGTGNVLEFSIPQALALAQGLLDVVDSIREEGLTS